MTKKLYYQGSAPARHRDRGGERLRDFVKFVALAQLRRAFRPVPQVKAMRPVVAAAVVAEEEDVGFYHAAADLLAHGQSSKFGREWNACVVSIESGGKKDSTMLGDALEKDRCFVIVSDTGFLPEEFKAVADAVVKVGRPDADLVKAAARTCLGLRLSELEATSAAGRPLRQLATAFRSGRTASRAVKILQRLDELASEPDARVEDGPTLDNLPGMGEAADWGRQLAADLADWKAGKIRWSDVDRGVLLSGPPASTLLLRGRPGGRQYSRNTWIPRGLPLGFSTGSRRAWLGWRQRRPF